MLVLNFAVRTDCYGQQGIPDKPELTYVTVDTSDNSIFVYWKPSAAPDVKWYFIYREVKTLSGWAGELIDSVPSSEHFFHHLLPGRDRLEYSVTAVDSAGNESIRMPGSHIAMLTYMKYDSCRAELTLKWNQYVGWNEKLSGYRVYGSFEGSPFSQITLKFPGDTTLKIKNVEENMLYRYYVVAVKNDGLLSSSGIADYFTYMPPPPSWMNLDEVNVLDKASAEILFSADLSGTMNDFVLYRSASGTSGFLEVQEAENIAELPYRFTDQVATSATSHTYRVDVLNSCREVVASSNTGNNILLSGQAEGTRAVISWTPYQSYQGSLLGYQVYRLSTDGGSEEAAFTGPQQTTFTEDLAAAGTGNLPGEVCYRVVAVEGTDNPYGIAGNSVSNVACVNVPTHIYMPNAFTPNGDGQNELFGPVIDFFPEKYLFIIFDRSGKKVFETTDPSVYWDGRMAGGPMATEGVYTWFIQFTSFNGSDSEQTGSVMVIYP